MHELTLPIVGVNYPNSDKAKTNRRSELMLLSAGAPLTLEPEPRNPKDSRAIAVWSSNGIQVGYVPAERAAWLGGKLREGQEVQAILQGLTEHAGWMRVRIGGGMPTLPAVREDEPPMRSYEHPKDDGFWPDPEGPDWGA